MDLQAKKHNLTVNLTTFRVWCYACEREVFLEQRLAQPPSPPSKFPEPVGVWHTGQGWQLGQVLFTAVKLAK